MKIIYRIAKLELSTLFYSPIAWLLLLIFSLQSGLKFISLLEIVESYDQSGRSLSNISGMIFSDRFRLWYYVKDNLYLYIPLLTMGVFSKEIGSGSIKLLYSSPVRFRQIVLGKFLAVVTYVLLLMVALVILVIAGGFAVEQLDYSYVFTGILGLFLLCCAYASIGLYISSLTSYQIVAAIGTLAVLSFFSLVGNYGQTIPVLKDILYWLSIGRRADDFIKGLISTRDLLYLIFVIILFLSLTIAKLNTEKKVFSKAAKTGIYVGLIAAFILLTYIASAPSMTLYKDMTVTNKNTLTPYSQNVVSKIKGPLKITNYVNLLDPYAWAGAPAMQNNDIQTTSMYTRFLPQIEYTYEYFYDSVPDSWPIKVNKGLSLEEIAKKMAKSHKVNFEKVMNPEEIKTRVDLTTEKNRFVRVLEYNGKEAFLRFYRDNRVYSSEGEITPTLKAMINGPAQVSFLTGNGERNIFSNADDGYNMSTTVTRKYRHALISKGFAFKEVTLSNPGDQPDETDILVVSDPKVPISETTLANIKEYIEKGGNMLLACEPGSYGYLQPVLNDLGITVMSGILYQKNEDFDPDFILAQVHANALNMNKAFNQVIVDTNVSFPGTLGLIFDDFGKFDTTPVVTTSPDKTWVVRENPETGALKDSIPLDTPASLVVGLTRKVNGKEQRIVVSGDADFMSNLEYTRRNIPVGNSKMVNPLFGWLTYNEFPADTARPPLKDTEYTLSENGISLYRIILNMVLPGLILIGSILLLLMRKRK